MSLFSKWEKFKLSGYGGWASARNKIESIKPSLLTKKLMVLKRWTRIKGKTPIFGANDC
jgi:hypothetical protein